MNMQNGLIYNTVVAFLIEEENKVQPVIQNVLSTIEIKN
jgi:hypothetical protein